MRGKMLKNPRNPEAFSGHYNGCSCCNPKRVRRVGKKSAKRHEERGWRKDWKV
jgi:hypothetical protein